MGIQVYGKRRRGCAATTTEFDIFVNISPAQKDCEGSVGDGKQATRQYNEGTTQWTGTNKTADQCTSPSTRGKQEQVTEMLSQTMNQRYLAKVCKGNDGNGAGLKGEIQERVNTTYNKHPEPIQPEKTARSTPKQTHTGLRTISANIQTPLTQEPKNSIMASPRPATPGLSTVFRSKLHVADDYPKPNQETAPTPLIKPSSVRKPPSPSRLTNCSPSQSHSSPHPPSSLSLPLKTKTYIQPLLTCPNVTPNPLSFTAFLDNLSPDIHLTKIGEGSFGEVYRAASSPSISPSLSTNLPPSSTPTSFSSVSSSPPRQKPTTSPSTAIIKLLPLNPPPSNRGRKPLSSSSIYTSIPSACNEIRLLDRMRHVPGFVDFRGACVLQGEMPPALIQQWVAYKDSGKSVGSRDPRGEVDVESGGESESGTKGKGEGEGNRKGKGKTGKKGAKRGGKGRGKVKKGYGPDQLWLMIEMADAGGDLEGWCRQLDVVSSSAQNVISTTGTVNGTETDTQAEEQKFTLILYTWDIFWQTALALAKAEIYASFEHRDLHLGNICVRQEHVPSSRIPSHNGSNPPPVLPSPFSFTATGMEVTFIDYSLTRAELADGTVLFHDFAADESLLAGEGDLQYDVYRMVAGVLAGDVRGEGGEEGEGSRAFRPVTNVVWLGFVLGKLMGGVRGGEYGGEDGMRMGENMRGILEELEGGIGVFEGGRRGTWDVGSAGELLGLGVQRGWLRVEDVIC